MITRSLALAAALGCGEAIRPKLKGSPVSITPGSDIPAVRVNSASVTVSGVSSGADMAAQFHIAHSLTVKGAGLIAPSPYYCAQANVEIALTSCMTSPELIDDDYLAGIMANTALWGYIDPLNGLKESLVWIFSATNDTIVNQGVVTKAASLYSRFLNDPSSQLFFDYTHPGEHAQVTANFGNQCEYLGEPFLNNCQYDGAGEILTFLYPGQINPLPVNDTFSRELAAIAWGEQTPSTKDLKAGKKEPALCVLDATKISSKKRTNNKKSSSFTAATLPDCSDEVKAHVQGQTDAMKKSSSKKQLTSSTTAGVSGAPTPVLRAGNGTLYTFNQGLFVGGGGWSSSLGLAEFAFIFIPDACLQIGNNGAPIPAGGCLEHIAFHGCEQTVDDINHLFMTGSNYIPHALNSNLVILFPQAMSNALNPKGCWDWWGYSGPQYASSLGVQISVVKGVIDSLQGHAVMPPLTSVAEHEKAVQDYKGKMGKMAALSNRKQPSSSKAAPSADKGLKM